ncbi:hypothetical protein HZS_6532 [Henneguya salminicola]|nr:hypothetical protein HZS_6532 [Henneguya salminicola]
MQTKTNHQNFVNSTQHEFTRARNQKNQRRYWQSKFNCIISQSPEDLFCSIRWAGNIDGEFQRFLMGSAILRMGSELFIDATSCPFVQCLIVMSFDSSKNLFAPCF